MSYYMDHPDTLAVMDTYSPTADGGTVSPKTAGVKGIAVKRVSGIDRPLDAYNVLWAKVADCVEAKHGRLDQPHTGD